MSEFSKLSPDKGVSLEKRLQHMQSVQQQIMIDRAHGLPLLANAHGLHLDQAQESLVRRLADYCCHLRYQGLDDNAHRQMARIAAGTFPSELRRRFRGHTSGEDATRFAHYSAHDNTLLALLAHLGLRDSPVPLFAAYLTFELHASGEAAERPFVRVAYNHDPIRGRPVAQQQYLRLPRGDSIENHEKAVAATEAESRIYLDEFERTLFEERRSFDTAEEWRAASESGGPPPHTGEDAAIGERGSAEMRSGKQKKGKSPKAVAPEERGAEEEEEEGHGPMGEHARVSALEEEVAAAQARIALLTGRVRELTAGAALLAVLGLAVGVAAASRVSNRFK
jgi:hypothetical protein